MMSLCFRAIDESGPGQRLKRGWQRAGLASPRLKLSQVREIRALLQDGKSPADIARRYHVSAASVVNIAEGLVADVEAQAPPGPRYPSRCGPATGLTVRLAR